MLVVKDTDRAFDDIRDAPSKRFARGVRAGGRPGTASEPPGQGHRVRHGIRGQSRKRQSGFASSALAGAEGLGEGAVSASHAAETNSERSTRVSAIRSASDEMGCAGDRAGDEAGLAPRRRRGSLPVRAVQGCCGAIGQVPAEADGVQVVTSSDAKRSADWEGRLGRSRAPCRRGIQKRRKVSSARTVPSSGQRQRVAERFFAPKRRRRSQRPPQASPNVARVSVSPRVDQRVRPG